MPPHQSVAKLKILIHGPGNQDNAGLECDRTPVCYDRKSSSSTSTVDLLEGCFVRPPNVRAHVSEHELQFEDGWMAESESLLRCAVRRLSSSDLIRPIGVTACESITYGNCCLACRRSTVTAQVGFVQLAAPPCRDNL